MDTNQAEVVSALREIGAEVQLLHMVGEGCPDLLVAYRGKWFPIEVKDGSKPPSKRKLTPREELWHEQFSRQADVFICNSAAEAIEIVTTNER